MKFIRLLFLSFIAFSFQLNAQTNIPALITTNQVWDINGSPYLLNQNSYIDSGITVIVKPGVEVRSGGAYKIDINGEFQARGTWDSIIKISKVPLVFSVKSTDYNSTTGRGAYFNYCNIEGSGSGSTCLGLYNTALKVDHCTFFNSYFAINVMMAYPYLPVLTEITNSSFSGDVYGYGSPINVNNLNSRLLVTNCLFSNADNIYTYGNVVMRDNTFKKMRKITHAYMYGNNDISCNKFLNFTEGINLDMSNYTTKVNVVFNNNTLDSFGSNINFPYHMLDLSRKASNNSIKDSLVVSNNNFFYYKGKGGKVGISSTNMNPTVTDTVKLRNNYWGSNDSATIEGFIKDYGDDINVYGRVDFSGYKNIPVVGCSYNGGCAIANFNYSVSDTSVVFKDSSFSFKSYHVKWKFGDGAINDSNKTTVLHQYNQGTYQVCMYTYDSANNLCDSMCKTISVYHKTTCQASFYFAYDTSDVKIIYVINTSTGTNSRTKYYWTFGDGTGSSAFKPVHTYVNNGKYQLCLTIFDTIANCYSTYCDSVEIAAGEMSLVVLNEGDVLKVEKSGISNGLNIYPNPSKGEFRVLLNSLLSNEIKVEVMNTGGQIVKSGSYNLAAGYNEINIDLSDFDSGLYCLRISSGDNYKTIKLILNK